MKTIYEYHALLVCDQRVLVVLAFSYFCDGYFKSCIDELSQSLERELRNIRTNIYPSIRWLTAKFTLAQSKFVTHKY